MEAKKLGNTLVDEKAVPLIDVLEDTLADVDTKRLRETLSDLMKEALFNTLGNGLTEVGAKAR